MHTSTRSQNYLPPRWILVLLLFFASVWLLYELKELVSFLVIGYCIAYALHPVVSKVEAKGLPRGPAIFVVTGLIAIIFGAFFAIAAPTIGQEWERLTDNLGNYIDIGKEKLAPILEAFESKLPTNWRSPSGVKKFIESTPLLKESLNGEVIASVLGGIGGALLKGYNITLTLLNLILLPFIVFYLLLDFRALHELPLSLVPITKRKKITHLFSEMNSYVSSFVRGQFLVCTILFILYAVGLGLLGVELWLLLALIAGYGNLIPYVGTLTGILLSVLMSLVTYGDFSHVLFVLAVFAVVQIVEALFITPRILGDSVGLSPLAIILAIVIGGQLFGLLGIFLAVPGAAIVKVLAKHLHTWVVVGH